ncbi:MAG: bifunctional (p)ppGpp synthetase/guanosine-3',5'-bis(diphosphate) 3'-pyrophosphohydrolase [Oscillospiraceae bacterium]|jgi:GTP pyrophosphokinase|nr:bifunctional (p)ppGpp synthetase/guanosine-3',5'-bis(diphosphate) 3'-pyrophosphohydrolase [Oscillospiraceae bacterium]
MDEINDRYLRLETAIGDGNPSADAKRIRAAFEYSRKAHGTQKRKDGSEFITHPLAAAEIVLEIGLDDDSICAALLHDCIEDTGATHKEIRKLFGKDVADIVEGVTKLTRVKYTSKEKEQMENLRKMLIAMAKDIRVILIKIADRLHNMRTMEYQSLEKQREKALETMEIYAPIAHRLGMQKIKWELEDLSIQYLDPIGCAEISEWLKQRRVEHENFVNRIQGMITERLSELGIECSVFGRVKHMYSIYRKMYNQNKELSEVFDLYAFRVIVNDIGECYNVLGYIHDMFHPIPGYFKDYIGTPKPNMYQSLHTSVIGGDGVPFEVQIRTWEMHQMAEFGIAAHWKYKEGEVGKVADEEKFAWVRRLLESQQDSDAQDFFQALKIDMFADEVYVFTPNGDVVNLPAGSTPIDFAYCIHSAIGNRMTGAIVNGRMVPYTHILQSGDIVRILTSNASKGPSRDWLDIIKSPEARNKIRQWFKKEKREENIAHGKMAFESELRHANINLNDVIREDTLPKVLERLAFNSLDELYAAIGYGGISAQKAVNRIREEFRFLFKTKKKKEKQLPDKKPDARIRPMFGVMVEGIDNCLVKFARCCTPVPGDPVIGFITRGYGVSVHRQDCSNYIRTEESVEEAGRWVRVAWADTGDMVYQTEIKITAHDRAGIIVDIASILNALKIKMTSFTARDAGDNFATVTIVVDIRNRDELVTAIARLSSVPDVTDVKRIG